MTVFSLRFHRLLSIVAATLVALACGTNYVYSAWAPQFAERMKLSSTQSNLIGTAGNLGMYASGIPVGLLVDAKGPRPGLLIGAVSLGVGYFPIHRAYVSGKGSMGIPALFFFSFLTGLGSSSGFSGAIKTAASNFPDHRGTATSFPLAAFGLSAFFFSTVSAFAFPDDPGRFLLLLSIGTSTILFVCSFFVRLIPPSSPYASLSTGEANGFSSSSQLHRTKSRENRHKDSSELGRPNEISNPTIPQNSASGSATVPSESALPDPNPDETSSLMASSISPRSSHDSFCTEDAPDKSAHDSHHADIRGWAMLPTVEFWQLFTLLGLSTGIGLMTINNIGYNVKALWNYYDDSADSGFIQKRQAMHVSTLSILSCIGRLLSGIGSDLLVKKFNMSRFWCLFASAVIFCSAQFAGFEISDPHQLILVSGLTGLAYGFLFGVFPSLVAHTFGVGGISQNWGVMCLAPVISGNIFNLLYGSIYDAHSTVLPDGDRDCRDGLKCYSIAYVITFWAGVAGAAITLWTIWHERRIHGPANGKESHEHLVELTGIWKAPGLDAFARPRLSLSASLGYEPPNDVRRAKVAVNSISAIRFDKNLRSTVSKHPIQVLIELHRTLLHEHHDFFLASQHPSASPALRKLATKYAMPARMWKYGIHSYLELLSHSLPNSSDHMLPFIYHAYSLLLLLLEIVPALQDTWIECIDDLSRYRMVVEDGDIRDQKVWTRVARYWYNKADEGTSAGMQHHLATLASPNVLQRELSSYARSLNNFLYLGNSRSTSSGFLSGDTKFQQELSLPPDITAIQVCRLRGITFSELIATLCTSPTIQASVMRSKDPIYFLEQSSLFDWFLPSLLLSLRDNREPKDANSNSSSALGADDIILLIFSALSILVCFVLGQKLGHPRTFDTSMVVFNIVKLMTSADSLISPVGHWWPWSFLYLHCDFCWVVGKALPSHHPQLCTYHRLPHDSLDNELPVEFEPWSRGAGEQTDSATQYLLSSVAFTLICWWKIAEWSIPAPSIDEPKGRNSAFKSICQQTHN
ncbi:hypothetical protein AJ79_01517 [Helicocarpus griseus UAMH5409]|uniref:Uncharacterized protein n=1 Tax=Helicocarpus griseus UAMH5409 TaxID=1447875 RepID=A0A2B7Y756_9EURO|nr:hypothetical protein AJ79_01517 [Helicocarpus griseus UAMH5409]